MTFIDSYCGLTGEESSLSFERIVIVLGGRICHLHGERDVVIELLDMPLITPPPKGGEVLSRTERRGR